MLDNFNFNPPDGLLNKDEFPSNPVSEEAARGQFMTLFNQMKNFNNDVLIKAINSNTTILEGIKVTEKDDSICIEIVGGFKIQCGLATSVSNSWVGKGYPVPFTKKIYGSGAIARHETTAYPLIVRDDLNLNSIQFKNSAAASVNASWYAIGI